MNIFPMLDTITDRRSGVTESVEHLVSNGDWQFIQLNNYTSASPLLITAGNTSKITFQQNNISYTAGRGLQFNYDYVLQKFKPNTLNDVFMAEIRFKAKTSIQNGHGDLLIESPTFAFNPINGVSIAIPKAANSEQFISQAVPLFVGPDVLANGLEVKFAANAGNWSIYDVSFMIMRISSGK